MRNKKGDKLVTFYFYLENNRIKIDYTMSSCGLNPDCLRTSVINAFDPR